MRMRTRRVLCYKQSVRARFAISAVYASAYERMFPTSHGLIIYWS